MTTHQVRLTQPDAGPVSLVATVGADCTCWPDIAVDQHDNMVEVNVYHDDWCARLQQLKKKP